MTNLPPSPIIGENSDFGVAEIRAKLSKLERRDLWILGNSIIVILCLTAAVVSLSVTVLLKGTKTLFGIDLGFALRSLVALVLVFTAHMIYQHLRLLSIQRQLGEKQIQAEVSDGLRCLIL
jgi:hypothetical protein